MATSVRSTCAQPPASDFLIRSSSNNSAITFWPCRVRGPKSGVASTSIPPTRKIARYGRVHDSHAHLEIDVPSHPRAGIPAIARRVGIGGQHYGRGLDQCQFRPRLRPANSSVSQLYAPRYIARRAAELPEETAQAPVVYEGSNESNGQAGRSSNGRFAGRHRRKLPRRFIPPTAVMKQALKDEARVDVASSVASVAAARESESCLSTAFRRLSRSEERAAMLRVPAAEGGCPGGCSSLRSDLRPSDERS